MKAENKVRICNVRVILTPRGVLHTNTVVEAVEKKSMYVFQRKEHNSTRQILKDKLMKADTNLVIDITSQVGYHTWCLEADMAKADEMLTKKVLDTFAREKAKYELLNTQYTLEITK